VIWICWEWRHPHPIVELKLFKQRNFAAAMLSMFVLGGVLYGTTVLLPEFMQNLMGYPAVLSGEALVAGGLVMIVTMPTSGALTGRMDPRKLMAIGFGITSLGLYNMATHLSLGMDFTTVELLRIYQVAGLAFIFIPSNVLCYTGIPVEQNNQVSSMMNFVRNIGGSIGIALVGTEVTRATQTRRNFLAANLHEGSPVFRQWIAGLAATFRSHGMSAVDATRAAYRQIAMLMEQQAAALAFKDVVSILAVVVACLIPLAFIMVKPPANETHRPTVH
jgi:DHA2 family multidrug resistance protein